MPEPNPVQAGSLYVVATPIGNLDDISRRALDTLAGVAAIAAEDTRHSGRLLAAYGIRRPLISLHEHNEAARVEALCARLDAGESLALISDAGTPLVSDPGYRLVRAVRAAGHPVIPIPGPSALTAALCAAGLPTDRFVFEGFLPAKAKARRERLTGLRDETRTLVFYESVHRILDTLGDLAGIFGGGREAVIARELTKQFEEFRHGDLESLREGVAADAASRRGEYVLMVHGAATTDSADESEARRVLGVLLEGLPASQAAALAARLTGQPRKRLYQLALDLK